MTVFADRINDLGTENAFKIGDDILRCEQKGMKVVKLNLGEPDFNSADNINKVAIEKLMADRDVERLAKMVGELF